VRVVSSGVADCKIRQQVATRALRCCVCDVRANDRHQHALPVFVLLKPQQERSVTVTRCNERVFGPREWKLLEENLSVWNSSLSNMIAEAFPQP